MTIALAAEEFIELEFEEYCTALLSLTSNSDIDCNPSFKDAMNGPYISQFQAAINKEYASLDNNQVFIEVESLPPGFSALGTKMVLKIKETAETSMPPNFKARLCGQGFNQIYGIDYNETFAPVACLLLFSSAWTSKYTQ
jgi:hypothetical protein